MRPINHVKLLDCTLRDGAYLIEKNFGDNVIRGIIEGLVKAQIDYIEIGFFQNEGFGEGKTVFRNSEDALRFIPMNKQGVEFTVLADYSRFSVENLDERNPNSIDAIRECFFKNERFDAIEVCKEIKKKGYKLFIQPVDILGYSDMELIEFIGLVNTLEPYCFSIVDTFGSMFQEDLHRVFELINHNLIPTVQIGFHSHNNMQLSNALSQEFIRMAVGKREVIVDGTISGMGRGAGNTPTELIAQYMVAKLGASYNIDALLDIIDVYMDNIKSRCSWGYSTQFFLAGCYSAHVNNIMYLTKKNSIKYKDIRYILNKIDGKDRKRYDYELLEKAYLELLQSDIDDETAIEKLKEIINGKEVLVLVPGMTVNTHVNVIQNYIREKNPFIISVNFLHETIKSDYIYLSNVKRYDTWKNQNDFKNMNKIMTSNFPENVYDEKTIVVSFVNLIKCGWDAMDNSTVMLLRLLSDLKIEKIAIAGFDGYTTDSAGKNYSLADLEIRSVTEYAQHNNQEISEMLVDFNKTRRGNNMEIRFITPSRFEQCLKPTFDTIL